MYTGTLSDLSSEAIPFPFFHSLILQFFHFRSTEDGEKYHVAFEFNSDVDCRLSLLSSLPDSTELAALRHNPGSGVTSSHHYLFPRGSERKFIGKDFPLSPEDMREEDRAYDPENGHDTFPLAILLETAGGM